MKLEADHITGIGCYATMGRYSEGMGRIRCIPYKNSIPQRGAVVVQWQVLITKQNEDKKAKHELTND